MDIKWDAIKTLPPEAFRRLTGVKTSTFEAMLLMTLEYLREYRAYFHISQSYGIGESYAYKLIRWVEDTLIRSQVFSLPGRKALLKSEVEYEVVLVDASEIPIQRPKKAMLLLLRQEKAVYAKSQVVVDKTSRKVICTQVTNGRRHDFRLFKESGVKFKSTTQTVTGTGYQGIQKLHANSQVSKKKTKKCPLTAKDKKHNRELASQRVLNENVIGRLKHFKILADNITIGVNALAYDLT